MNLGCLQDFFLFLADVQFWATMGLNNEPGNFFFLKPKDVALVHKLNQMATENKTKQSTKNKKQKKQTLKASMEKEQATCPPSAFEEERAFSTISGICCM